MNWEQYTIISSIERSRLIEQVNQRLTDGWELYGPPYVQTTGAATYHYQAMVKPPQTPKAVRGLSR